MLLEVVGHKEGDGVEGEGEGAADEVGEAEKDDEDGGGVAPELLVGAEHDESEAVEEGAADGDEAGDDAA